jgi:hypothetical protein
MSRAPLLGLFHELHSQCGNGIPYQAGLMSHNHVNIFRWNNLPRRIDHVPYQRLAPDFVQNLWTLAFEPRSFSRSHNYDCELHRPFS